MARKYFAIIVLFRFFCFGKIQIGNDINDYKLQETLFNQDEEHIGFFKSIPNYPGILLERKGKMEPCGRIQPEIVQAEEPINNKILATANRRSYFKEPAYKHTITTENAISHPKVLQEYNQLKNIDPTVFEKNLWHRELNKYNDNFVNTDVPVERISVKDFNDDKAFVIPPVEKERVTEKNLDLKQISKRLMNSIPTPIEKTVAPTNVQCANKNHPLIDQSRRFMEPNDKQMKNISNDDLYTNTNLNILVPKVSAEASNSDYLKKSNFNQNFNFSGFSKSGISLEPFDSDLLKSDSELSIMRRDDDELSDPTQGKDISNIMKTKLMLMNYDKVCYACSSANNPTCLSPDRRTTVKYCRKGVDSCVIKTYKTGDSITVIRDCGKSCDDFAVRGLGLKYRSCSICHSDLCNSAYSNNIHSVMFTIISTISLVLIKILF